MATDLSDRPGRGGITVNDRGDQAVLGFWPEKFDASTSGWVGQLRLQFNGAVRIAQRHHERNQALVLAKATKQPFPLPEPDVRQKVARSDQKQLRELHLRALAI